MREFWSSKFRLPLEEIAASLDGTLSGTLDGGTAAFCQQGESTPIINEAGHAEHAQRTRI